MTLGITTEGEAYGISFAPGNQTNDSYLHTINLETAECEAIGPTGFPINYVQTMTYDHNNDQMLVGTVLQRRNVHTDQRSGSCKP